MLKTLACSRKPFSDQLENVFLARVLPIVLVRSHVVHRHLIYSKRNWVHQICILYEINAPGRIAEQKSESLAGGKLNLLIHYKTFFPIRPHE